MKYFLYQLKFDTPVHFGSAEEGGKLEQSNITYRADTLFSALCCELSAMNDANSIEKLYELAKQGNLLFSDLFPYYLGKRDCFLYLPKPVFLFEQDKNKNDTATNYNEMRKKATEHKKIKKRTFIRISQLQTYIDALKEGRNFDWEMPDFGQSDLMTRVDCTGKESVPYYVNQFTFSDNSGLYGIIGYEKAEDIKWIFRVIESLGYSGIGGKRSSGYGKYHCEDPIYLDADGCYKDDKFLYSLLNNNADQYMNISVLLPQKEDISIVKNGQYTLCKRSGFITPDGISKMTKKNDVYMLQSGSCFPMKISGSVISVSDELAHPIWRYGKSMYVGLSL